MSGGNRNHGHGGDAVLKKILRSKRGEGYTCIKPTQAVPRIISTNGRNNIEAIKSYFTDEQVIRATGMWNAI